MEINVGDYVRGFRGINKVIKIEPYNNSYFYYTDGKNNNEGKPFYFERHITKHSKDIIDLIEVGDYVNGSKVIDIRIEEKLEIGVESDNLIYQYIQNNDIKSILTHEQFESNAYKVEKEV